MESPCSRCAPALPGVLEAHDASRSLHVVSLQWRAGPAMRPGDCVPCCRRRCSGARLQGAGQGHIRARELLLHCTAPGLTGCAKDSCRPAIPWHVLVLWQPTWWAQGLDFGSRPEVAARSPSQAWAQAHACGSRCRTETKHHAWAVQVLRRAFRAQAAIVVSSLDPVPVGRGQLVEGHACAVVQVEEHERLR